MFVTSDLHIEIFQAPFFTHAYDDTFFFHAQSFPAQEVLPRRIAHCSQLPTNSGAETPQLTGSIQIEIDIV